MAGARRRRSSGGWRAPGILRVRVEGDQQSVERLVQALSRIARVAQISAPYERQDGGVAVYVDAMMPTEPAQPLRTTASVDRPALPAGRRALPTR